MNTKTGPMNHNLFTHKTLAATIRHLLAAQAVGAIMLGALQTAQANPTGGQVMAGSAEIVQQGARMDINQASQRAVINWQSFSIDHGEHVNFNQPGRDAATLNRVIGNDPSAILGRLTANGNVYLVNQNGILVGKDAQINVGSLIATTANINTQDFMEGRMIFNEAGHADARIVNYGNITVQQGGLVALVAPGVENHGAIHAKLGKISLASGEAFTLDFYGDQLINLTVTPEQLAQIIGADGKPLSNSVSNTGEIIADGGIVTLMAGTGKAIVDSLINLQGYVQAQTVENRNGVITLMGDEGTTINVAGVLDASGQTESAQGGQVEIRAGEVNLQNGSLIDVSGRSDGGIALVGGDFQGSGDGVRAQNTTVARHAAIDADSKIAGDGGKVIVWADDNTVFEGVIDARGGSEAGNGGFVEVSGKNTLHFDGDVDASAKQGKAGELLLDPGDLIVKEMTVDENKTAAKPNSSGSLITTTTSYDAAVNVQKVNYLLQNGTSVALQAGNDLTVAATIDARAGTTGAGLTLTGGQNVNIYEDIYTNKGAITVKAISGDIVMNSGTVLYADDKQIKLEAGNNISAEHLVTKGAIVLNALGDVNLNQALAGEIINNSNQGIGSLAIKAGGDVSLNGIQSNGEVSVSAIDQANSVNHLNVHQAILTNGNVGLSAENITIAASGVIDTRGSDVNNFQSGNSITITGLNDVIVNADLIAKDAALNLTSTAGSVKRDDGLANPVVWEAGNGLITLDAYTDLNFDSIKTTGQAVLIAVTGSLTSHESLAAANPSFNIAENIVLKDVCITQDLNCGVGQLGTGQAEEIIIGTNGGYINHTGKLLTDHNLKFQTTSNNGTISLGEIEVRKNDAELTINANKSITLNGALLTDNNGKQVITSSNGSIIFNANVLAQNAEGLKATASNGAITFNEDIGFSNKVALGSLEVNAKNAITVNKDISASGNISLYQLGETDNQGNGLGDVIEYGSIYSGGDVFIGKDALVNNVIDISLFGNSKIIMSGEVVANIIRIGGNLDVMPTDASPTIKTVKSDLVSSNSVFYNYDANDTSMRDSNGSFLYFTFDENTGKYVDSDSSNPDSFRVTYADFIKHNVNTDASFYQLDTSTNEVFEVDSSGYRLSDYNNNYITLYNISNPLELKAVSLTANHVQVDGNISSLDNKALYIKASPSQNDRSLYDEINGSAIYYDRQQNYIVGYDLNRMGINPDISNMSIANISLKQGYTNALFTNNNPTFSVKYQLAMDDGTLLLSNEVLLSGGGTNIQDIYDASSPIYNNDRTFNNNYDPAFISQPPSITQSTIGETQKPPTQLSSFNGLNVGSNNGTSKILDNTFSPIDRLSLVSNPDAVAGGTGGGTNSTINTNSSNITNQTLGYANQGISQSQDSSDEEDDSDDRPEIIFFATSSEAQNADLGRGSPEDGATMPPFN